MGMNMYHAMNEYGNIRSFTTLKSRNAFIKADERRRKLTNAEYQRFCRKRKAL